MAGQQPGAGPTLQEQSFLAAWLRSPREAKDQKSHEVGLAPYLDMMCPHKREKKKGNGHFTPASTPVMLPHCPPSLVSFPSTSLTVLDRRKGHE